MTSKPKRAAELQKPEVFTEKHWERPPSRKEGEKGPEAIYAAVGEALTKWETLEAALARFFLLLTGSQTAPLPSQEAVRRAYGSIFGNHGRRTAVRSAAEVYLASYWHHKAVRDSINDLLHAIECASKRRDDIAHGVVQSTLILTVGKPGTTFYGSFLMPPDYNTGFTHARPQLKSDHVLDRAKSKYRYGSDEIKTIAAKFELLRVVVDEYSKLMETQPDGKIAAIEEMLKRPR